MSCLKLQSIIQPLASLLVLLCVPVAWGQTQHGPAPADQELVLPPPRPDISDATTGPLFPPSVESERFLRLATGPIRGGYYAVGGVICDLINAQIERHRIECLVRPTSGSAENISHVLGGGTEMGLVQSDWQSFAVTSAEQSAGSSLNFDRLRSVAALYPLTLQLVVREGVGIDSLSSLSGRAIGLPADGSGQRQLADVVLAQAGISGRNLQVREYNSDADMARALCAQEIEAFFLVGPAPIQTVDVTLSRCGAQLLAIDDGVASTLIGDRQSLTSLQLDAKSYPAQKQPIQTVGFVVTLVTSAGLDDRLVAEVARHLVEGVGTYSRAHPALSSVDGSGFFTQGLTAPVHNGVARYLDTLAPTGAQTDLGGDVLVGENGG